MKNIKLIGVIALATIMLFLTGCGAKVEKVEGTLEELMTKVYTNIPDEEKPMMLGKTELTKENVENFLGTNKVEFEEGLVSESMVGSIPHSVVLLRVNDKANVDEIKKTIKENANPRKWICVEAE